jgi:hypothetical protein
VSVDQESPHVLERDVADELLDVDAAIAQRATCAVRLSDLGRERNYAFEAGLNFAGCCHRVVLLARFGGHEG